MDDKSFLSMYCRLCQAPRYRSIQPMGRKDQVKPELFKALDPECPPPAEGPAKCFLCQESLVIMADNKLPPLKKSEPVRRVTDQKELVNPPEVFHKDDSEPLPLPAPASEASVEVLFELGSNEEMKSFQDYPESMLIVTNKRVLRVKKG